MSEVVTEAGSVEAKERDYPGQHRAASRAAGRDTRWSELAIERSMAGMP